MSDRRNTIQITPFLGVRQLQTSIDFYTNILDFGAGGEGGGYAYLERERVAIRLLQVSPDNVPRIHTLSCYIDVHDVDDEIARLDARLRTLPPDRWKGPINQSYNQRELIVRDPDDHLIIYGQGLGPNSDQWNYRFRE